MQNLAAQFDRLLLPLLRLLFFVYSSDLPLDKFLPEGGLGTRRYGLLGSVLGPFDLVLCPHVVVGVHVVAEEAVQLAGQHRVASLRRCRRLLGATRRRLQLTGKILYNTNTVVIMSSWTEYCCN